MTTYKKKKYIKKSKCVEKYQSHLATYVKMAQIKEAATIGYMYIEGEGTLGYHEAPIPQLFIVVEGEGWVTGENQKRIPIRRGEAALWEKGEWHTSGSETGMTAIVIQSEELHPETFMERKKHA
ncbi:cupin domain-containing protein [Priestia megaterium]|jgi:quercetin dioxygenase-like cupin family protein|uniref:cupin domain-containing protein n=1 Tax=Priestia megaterium TaxID=1404 RepID=UPI002E1AB4A2|nr:cupin domain-containing protein [Priestia megaterium]MED4293925.1 cupin domain-containing protein [Priestia megaterium]